MVGASTATAILAMFLILPYVISISLHGYSVNYLSSMTGHPIIRRSSARGTRSLGQQAHQSGAQIPYDDWKKDILHPRLA